MLILAMPAAAQLSNAQTIAAASGRIIGAAKACGVNDDRLAKLGEKALAVAQRRAVSERDYGSALGIFASAYNTGIDHVAAGKVTCREARWAINDIEGKFARY